MNYITVKETADKWGVSERTVQHYCVVSKIPGAKCIGKQWLIPETAEQPTDGRKKRAGESAAPYHFPILCFSPYFEQREEMNDAEKKLLQAQLLHWEGKFYDSMVVCRELLADDLPPYLAFGTHFAFGFNALLLGLYAEYQGALDALRQILDAQTEYREDLKLIIAALTYHGTMNCADFMKIDPLQLSTEAGYYYKYLTIMQMILSPKETGIPSFGLLYADFLTIPQSLTPVYNTYCFMLGVQKVHACDIETRRKFLEKAIQTAVSQGWTCRLTKYLSFEPQLVFEIASSLCGKSFAKKIRERQKLNVRNWMICSRFEKVPSLWTQFDVEQRELLLLISYDYSYEQLAKIKGRTVSEMKKEIGFLCNAVGIETKAQLVKYSGNVYNGTSANIDV